MLSKLSIYSSFVIQRTAYPHLEQCLPIELSAMMETVYSVLSQMAATNYMCLLST